MVGPSTALVLKRNDIFTIGDLAKIEQNKLVKILGVKGLFFADSAKGIGSNQLMVIPPLPKSISSGNTFFENTDQENEINAALVEHTKIIVKRLKSAKLLAKKMSITIKLDRKKMFTKTYQFDQYEDDLEKMIY
jgi:DNA polymerase-4